ncbi:MAG: helix-turn-helix domain-containing protein [Gammaproteobacteria bacterium]
MLALADYSNDQGGSIHPSMASIARRLRISESQARRVIHRLIDDGWLSVIGNDKGGAPGATRRYRINVEKLLPTPGADATRTPGADARDGSHPCAQTGRIAMTPEPSVEPPLTKERGAQTPRSEDSRGTRFVLDALPAEWMEYANSERPEIRAHDEFEIFRDYWISQPGQKGVKLDWFATWRNWIRRSYTSHRRERPKALSGAAILANGCAAAFEPDDI